MRRIVNGSERLGSDPGVAAGRSAPAPYPDDEPAAHHAWPPCDATTRLTTSEFATLSALARAVDPLLRRVTCELAAGHGGPHIAFTLAAPGGEHWWWVRWSVRLHEVVRLDPCDGEGSGPYRDCCLLPVRHPGPHSFEIRARRRHGTPHVDRVSPVAASLWMMDLL
jgi:hypothetical protein